MTRDDERQHLSQDLIWALKLVRQGYDEAAIVKTLSTRHPKHGYHSRAFYEILDSRGSEAARRYAIRTAQKAATFAKEGHRVTNPYEALERLQKIWERVDAEPWPLKLAGRRRALEAAFSIGFERGRVANMFLDLRTHAMRAGQELGALRRHRIALDEMGWLRAGPMRRGRRSSLVSFQCPEKVNIEVTFLRTSYVQEPVLLAHDAFRSGALGDRGWSRVSYFAAQPEIADEALQYLDQIALRHGTINTGYREGMRFREQRRTRDAVILCSVSEASRAS
jgi:hypothetical protein